MEIGRHRRTLQVEPLDATQPAPVEQSPAIRRETDTPEPVAVADASPASAGPGSPGRKGPLAKQS